MRPSLASTNDAQSAQMYASIIGKVISLIGKGKNIWMFQCI